MTRVLVACAPFKGTIGAVAATRTVADALRRAGCDVDERPLPDGGEDTASVLGAAWGLRQTPFPTRGVIGQATDASAEIRVPVGVKNSRRIAVVESASCLGLTLVPASKRQPQTATSRSLGLLLQAVIADGVTDITVALGGTGTVDGGRGLLAVLPALPPGVRLTALVDVQAPLVGPTGARAFFAQKGLPDALHDATEAALATLHPRFLHTPGAGAAGGLGAAVLALGGTLVSGAVAVIDATDVAGAVARANVVIGGEGAVDATSRLGKSLWVLRDLAMATKRPFAVVCGRCELPAADVGDLVVTLGEAGLVDPPAALRAAALRIAPWVSAR